MTPVEAVTTIAGGITALGGGFFFRQWISTVNTTLKEVTTNFQEHLISEEAMRGELRLVEEHMRRSNEISRELLEEIKDIKAEQVRVKVELATVANTMSSPRAYR